MSMTNPDRFLRGLSNHSPSEALGGFPNPLLDPFRWITLWDDFNIQHATDETAGAAFGWARNEDVAGTLGLSPTVPSALELTTAANDNDHMILSPASSTGTDTATAIMSVGLQEDKDIIVASRFRVDEVELGSIAIGLGINVEATIEDSTPKGMLIQCLDASPAIQVRMGDTATVTVQAVGTRVNDVYNTIVAYYRAADTTLRVWADNVLVASTNAEGALDTAQDVSAMIAVMAGSAAAREMLVDWVLFAVER